MKYRGLTFQNAAEKTVEIDIEGYIGYDYWDDEQTIIRTKEKMKAELKKLGELNDVDTIIVNINSYGGDVNHGISIHDLLAQNKAKVITKINGMTASAATIIAMAGDERHMSDNALFLVHNAWNLAIGNKNQLKADIDDLEKVDGRIANIYSKVTGKTTEEMQAVMDRNNGNGEWLTADQAKELGFITDIFEPKKAAAAFSNDLLKKHGLPPVPSNGTETPIINEENIAETVFMKVKGFFADLIKPQEKSKNQIDMKKFPNLTAILNVEEFEVTENGVLLTEEQLNVLDLKINHPGDIAAAVNAAKKPLNEFVDGVDEIDDTIKDAETLEAKLTALKAFMDKKPATKETGIEKEKDDFDDGYEAVAKDPVNKELDNL
jgi:ATP-dependent protease ClpP protease subunit